MFGGLGGMTPTGMPAFTFGGGEAGFDLSAAGLFGGAGAGGYNPTTPKPAASSSSAGTSNNSKSKSNKSVKKTKAPSKPSPTMINEVPQEDVQSTPPTPVDPSILPELIDGSTSEDAKAFDTDADDDEEASLTNAAANDASLDEDDDVPDTPTKAPPRDDE